MFIEVKTKEGQTLNINQDHILMFFEGRGEFKGKYYIDLVSNSNDNDALEISKNSYTKLVRNIDVQ